MLARPLKSGRAQTIPSRFLQRLSTVADKEAWREAKARAVTRFWRCGPSLIGRHGSILAGGRSQSSRARRQPLRLSVTEIEKLYRDPYAIYARHILGLQPLEPLAVALGVSDRGSLLHDIVSRFAEVYASTPPDRLAQTLERIATEAFAPIIP